MTNNDLNFSLTKPLKKAAEIGFILGSWDLLVIFSFLNNKARNGPSLHSSTLIYSELKWFLALFNFQFINTSLNYGYLEIDISTFVKKSFFAEMSCSVPLNSVALLQCTNQCFFLLSFLKLIDSLGHSQGEFLFICWWYIYSFGIGGGI